MAATAGVTELGLEPEPAGGEEVASEVRGVGAGEGEAEAEAEGEGEAEAEAEAGTDPVSPPVAALAPVGPERARAVRAVLALIALAAVERMWAAAAAAARVAALAAGSDCAGMGCSPGWVFVGGAGARANNTESGGGWARTLSAVSARVAVSTNVGFTPTSLLTLGPRLSGSGMVAEAPFVAATTVAAAAAAVAEDDATAGGRTAGPRCGEGAGVAAGPLVGAGGAPAAAEPTSTPEG